MKAQTLLAVATFAVAVAAGASAHATELITNGSFESGDTGWADSNAVKPSGFNNINAQDGSHFLQFGCVGIDCSTSQTVSDNAGDTLQLSYWYIGDGGQPSDFSVRWNGVTVPGSVIVNAPDQRPSGWVQYTFLVTATGSDTVAFLGRNDPSWDGLDNVSLTQAAPGVPEPTSWALMLTGFLGAGAALRSRRRAALAATA